ncbi:aminotransferase class V-fold PLP-dependent enzyme [Nonomuraea sp. B12E4]|uniref:aminotransferase class V-fold PLP-dependent enzyme n=1 Tax=Nonomuraea sp. B12E4 TaxID=3153564 RepID=UPI00325E4758
MTDDTVERLRDWQGTLREQFPIIASNPHLAYMDSAATTQKPQAVLDTVTHYLTTSNANTGRGGYPWANSTTVRLERAAELVKRFLGDPHPESTTVEFVSGASQGLRAVAMDWLADRLTDGDEIIAPFADHKANLEPWLEVQGRLLRRGISITVHPLPIEEESGDYDYDALAALINDRTKFAAVTHVHHVYGGDMGVQRIRSILGPDIPICLDAAQSAGRMPLSMEELDVDFAVFSGHKTMALPGVGAVWARNKRGPEFVAGGWRGTPNTTGIVSLEAALNWLSAAGLPNVHTWTVTLAARLANRLGGLEDIELLGCRQCPRENIVTFRHRRVNAGELGSILAANGIMVRADEQLHPSPGGAVRVSLHIYNTPEEVEHVVSVLGRA